MTENTSLPESPAAVTPKRPWIATMVALVLFFLAGMWLLPITIFGQMAAYWKTLGHWAAFMLMILPAYLLTVTGFGLLKMKARAPGEAIGSLVVLLGYVLAVQFMIINEYRHTIAEGIRSNIIAAQPLPSYLPLLLTLAVGGVCVAITAWVLNRPQVTMAYRPRETVTTPAENVE